MKRILTYILAAAAMMLMSCTDNLEFGKMNKDVLSLEAFSTELQTKAVAGEDAYKENTITSVEWFFFKDAEGTQLLHQEHSDGAHLELQTPETGTYSDLRYKSYLYAVANITLPTAPEGGWTLEKLLEIPVSTNFTKTAKDDEGEDGQVLDIANLNFIMDTYDEESGEYLFELVPEAVDDARKITVPLSRLAVKFTTKIKIAKEVNTVDSFDNPEKWTPVLSETDFDVYMVDALKAGYLSGEPVRRAEATDEHITGSYFTYNRNLAAVEEVEDEEDDDYYVWQTVNPFYTYPQTWNGEDNGEPFIKVIFPWMSDVKGSSEFHYKIVLPEPEYIAADPEDESSTAQVKFTLSRNCWYQVTATIAVLGGTENDYVFVDQVEYSVADWADPAWTAGSGLSSPIYFLVPKTVFHIYSTDEFDIPFYCDNQTNVTAYFTSVSFWDYKQTPSVERKGTYTNKPTRVTLYGGSGDNQWGNSNPYTLAVDNEEKVVTFTHSMANTYVLREIHLVIYKNASKSAEVTIYQHPAIELKKQGAGDVFVNGHFARVTNAVDENGNSFGTRWRVDNQSPYYYHSLGGWDNYYERIGAGSDGTNGYGTIMGDASGLSGGISDAFYTTDVTITAFSTSNNTYTVDGQSIEYKIGDPRVEAGNAFSSFNPYVYGRNNYGTNATRQWQSPRTILICSSDVNHRSTIAPHILVSSALNAMSTSAGNQVTHANAAKRAATYQEAGYPAGRWRLPTEAEIAFIIARQNDGTIPILFAKDSEYWSASGLITAGTNSITRASSTSNTQAPCRFVYDLWYWGEETLSSNQYHPNMHIESD